MFGRNSVITAAAVLFIILAIFSIAGGAVLIAASAFPASFAGITFIGQITAIDPIVLALLGVLYLGLGVVDIPVVYLLWKSRRSGGIMGLILAIIQLVTFAITPLFPVLWVGGIVGATLAVILIVLVAVRWNTLR
jgi:hypothetical protein